MNKPTTKGIAKRVANEAKIDSKRVHVIWRLNGKWSVKKEGKIKPHKVLDTRKEAISIAKELVSSGKASEVVVHKKNGKFQ